MDVDDTHAVGCRHAARGAAFFQESRAFELNGGTADVVARYAATTCCSAAGRSARSSTWRDAPAVVRVPRGAGDVVLIGFRPQFRAWPTGTYKLIFNSIFGAAARGVPATE
jgi:hypothetical protein